MPIDKEKIRQMIRKRAGMHSTGSCPVCVSEKLNILVVEGVEQDFCDSCFGIWLDAGEASSLAEGLSDFPDFDWSWSQRKQGKKRSVRHPEQSMCELPYAKGEDLIVDYCPLSKGIWLDGSELGKLELIIADHEDPAQRLHKLAREMTKEGYICL
jgi:Zn-finger nucleic acid-binding protein